MEPFLFLLANPNINIYLAFIILFFDQIKKFIIDHVFVELRVLTEKFYSVNEIKISGYHTIVDRFNNHDYSESFLAVCFYLKYNKMCNSMAYVSNSNYASWFFNDNTNKKDMYIIEDFGKIICLDNIYIQFNKICVKNNDKISIYQIDIHIRSKSKSIDDLQKFIDECCKQHKQHQKRKLKNKIYHFIYQETNSDKKHVPKFSSNLISNLADDKTSSFESFSTIFNEHKESITKSIDRLSDISYFKKHGLKRKKGYLFYGKPGCGKTSTTMAIANHCKRHIIEVPLSRVKTNIEMENILNITEINGIKFKKSEIIFLFDEIDMSGDCIKRDVPIEPSHTHSMVESTTETDHTALNANTKLNLGTLLSRLDGIGNYDGIIYVATTNDINKLDPALFRYGRLEAVCFDFLRRIDTKYMIENFYQITIKEKIAKKLPDRKISPVDLLQLLENKTYQETVTYLLDNC